MSEDGSAATPATTEQTPQYGAPPPPAAAGYQWPDELRGVAAAKGWDKFGSPADALPVVASAYVNAEKLLGGQKVPLPGKDARPEDWDRVYDALGRPKSPNDYHVERPGDIPNDFPYSDEILKRALPDLHKLGQTPGQVQGLWNLINKINVDTLQAHQSEMRQRADDGDAQLRREWGADYARNAAMVERTVTQYGGDEFAGWMKQYGFDKDPQFMRTFARIGGAMGEHRGTEASVSRAAGGAGAERDRLMADPAFGRALDGKDGIGAKRQAQHQWDELMVRLATEERS